MVKLPEPNSWNLMFFVFAIALILLFSPTLSTHVKPNGPMIGGDVYQAFGAANAIGQGHSPWQDAVYAGEYNWYPWLFHVLTVLLAKVTFSSIASVFVWMPLIVTLLLAVVYNRLGKELFNPAVGFLTAFIVVFMTGVGHNSQVPVPVNFSYVIAGAYFLFLYRAHESRLLKDMLLTGVFLGLVGLTHLHTFFACLVVLASYLFVSIIFKNTGSKGFRIPMAPIKLFVVALVVGFLVALPYLYPISTYGFTTARPIGAEIGSEAPKVSTLFYENSILVVPLFYLAAFGLFLGYKRRNSADLIAWSLVLACFFGLAHDLVTTPLLHFELQPYKFSFLTGPAYALAAAFAIYYIAQQLLKAASLKKDALPYIVAVLAILLLFTFSAGRGYFTGQAFSNQWGADQELPVFFSDTVEWVLQNTENDAVLFSGPFTGNIVNTWTGRRVAVSEISHSSIFLDIEKKYADAQEFYTSPPERAHEIAKSYGADYVLISVYEYQQYQQMGFDPAGLVGSDKFEVVKEWQYPSDGGQMLSTYVLSVE